MIEPHVEAHQSGKLFDSSSLGVQVADRADRIRFIGKLFLVAADAGQVIVASRHHRSSCITVAAVTQQTRQTRMLWVVMFES